MKRTQHAAHYPKLEKMGLFRHPGWWPKMDQRTAHVVESGHHFRTPQPERPLPRCDISSYPHWYMPLTSSVYSGRNRILKKRFQK